ncbi:uncharacterized protein N7496_003041 [Penicillium cataractarum]|uniref:Zn(2)-C6 fungal-type domain-containing protein n=1 Tax=Penicillium cataractarum TaxID=2100454 RepID=A0A9W9SL96_9EURO|nr:uncharacterized protein N7496_003041 [Penicillium cataractarum]KAJ5380613.1 hypothetical protein N7496_003041 [Penicillium cataractarum]
MEALDTQQQPTNPRSSSQESASTPKRSRVVISQSKRGCITCKTRRVKCDEQRPLCWRCIQAGRLCGGYNQGSKVSSALRPALKIGVPADSHTERLSYLAAHVLSLDSDDRPLATDGVWGRIFLQLMNQVECVKAAAAAFGAACESLLNNATVEYPSPAWRYYGSALARLQSELNNETAIPESLALASLILAAVEILSQHEQNAFAHFLGAVQILTKTHPNCRGAPSADILRTFRDELVNIDVLIGSYALSRTPTVVYLGSHEAVSGDDMLRKPELAIKAAMLCLHQSYQFIESADRLRYTYPSWKEERDPIMCNAQSDVVAQCCSILDTLAALSTSLQAQFSSTTSTRSNTETLADIYVMRAQLTVTIIFLLCVHNPYETGYDKHLERFQSIVRDAAAATRLRRRTRSGAFKRFSMRPGIVNPLFIVGLKCRDPPLRALATRMLREQGREGPVDGQIMAAICARLAALETASSVPSSPGAPLAACDVLETQRVHGYMVPPPRLDDKGRRVVDVVFMWPYPPLAQGLGHVDYSGRDSWIYRSEPIHI